ncbi:acyltransferase family protein, partial [Klebsiella pneumoniae]
MMLLFIGIVGLEDLISRKKTILTKAVETLGNISYSLYLIHPFALVITAKALKSLQIKNGLLFTSAMLLTSIVAGLLFYLL